MAKILKCCDVGMDCAFEAQGESEEDLLQQAAEHVQAVHGLMEVSPELVAKVRAAIRDVPASQPPGDAGGAS